MSPTCVQEIAAAERRSGIPPKLLRAIGLAETARVDSVTMAVTPWAWSINANGAGAVFATKDEAIAAVQAKLAAGVTSIDVGCMQINLAYHPRAFATLQEAFEPAANVAYAAQFLTLLYRQTGNWADAAAQYHSQTPERGASYLTRVVALWPNASAYPGTRRPADPASVLPPNKGYTPAFYAWMQQNARDTARLHALHGVVGLQPGSGHLKPRAAQMADAG